MLQTIRTPGGTRIEEIGKKRGERFIELPHLSRIVRIWATLRNVRGTHLDSVPFKEVGNIFFLNIVVNLLQRIIVHDAHIAKLINREGILARFKRILCTVRTSRINFQTNTIKPSHLTPPFKKLDIHTIQQEKAFV